LINNNASSKINKRERQLLDLLQTGFSVSSRPYLTAAEEMNMTEDDVVEMVKNLRSKGIIRRIGGLFSARKLGFTSTLVALQVEKQWIEKVAHAICSYPGVTHCYERNHFFNLWFTLTSSDRKTEKKILTEIDALPGVEKLRNFPALKKFKLKVNFSFSEDSTN
jgi:siroheme decarboxylase